MPSIWARPASCPLSKRLRPGTSFMPVSNHRDRKHQIAVCRDGSTSHSYHRRGTCSRHAHARVMAVYEVGSRGNGKALPAAEPPL
ncbi:DUF3761 domain-containing protein [Labrys neptuniae]